jgi:hypothetical protein
MLFSPGFTWGYARFDPLRRILYLIATGLTTSIDKHVVKIPFEVQLHELWTVESL